MAINPIYNSTTRMTGLSGLDTESMVASLMQLEQAKLDKETRSKDLLVMKQEVYREVTTALKGFLDTYFNTTNASKDMRRPSAYNAYGITYGGEKTSAYFSAVAGSGTNAGSYTISNIVMAKAAKVSGIDVSGEIAGSALTTDAISTISSSENNNKISVTFNGTTKEIVLDDSPADADINTLRTDLQDKLNTAFGTGKITVGIDSDKLTFDTESTNSLSFAAVAGNTGLASIGLEGQNTSNKISTSANIFDINSNFATALSLTGTDGDISFTINGQSFSFNSATTSLNDIMSEVNANKEANVTMRYDSLNNKFSLESDTTGAVATITASDGSGGLLSALSITAVGVAGTDASMTYNDGENGEQVITRSSNSFSINGIAFDLKKDYAGSVEVAVESDPKNAIDLVKGFVEKYNEVLDLINSKLSERRDYNYEPLIESDRDAMSEDEVKKWDEKVKTGLLANDSVLRSIATNLRNAMAEAVDGTGLSLSAIGIRSTAWTDKGKLSIDEEKLRSALSENPERVISMFTKQSDVLYNTASTDPAARAERRSENGVIFRLYDVIQDNIRTTTVNNRKGALLEKAGIPGDRSATNNDLFKQIKSYEDKIDRMTLDYYDMEDHYYSQFAVLEKLINDMNSQSSWLSQFFAS